MRIVTCAAVPERDWNAFVDANESAWFWHRTEWLAYCRAYRPDAVDLSFAVLDDAGVIRAICPLLKEGDAFLMCGEPCIVPVADQLDRVDVWWPGVVADAIAAVAKANNVARGQWRPMPWYGWSYWIQERYIGWETVVIDLRQSEKDLWSGLRRSYRSLIHRAEEEYEICQHALVGGGISVRTMQRLHAEAAGRETRLAETWNLMARYLDARHAIALLAFKSGEPRGFVYVYTYKDWAYYGHAACLDPNVNHALLWQAILACKALGLCTFEVGWTGHATDEKGQAIEHFRRGFSDARMPVGAVERTFP